MLVLEVGGACEGGGQLHVLVLEVGGACEGGGGDCMCKCWRWAGLVKGAGVTACVSAGGGRGL